MPSTEQRSGEPKPPTRDYVEIIKSDLVVDKKFVADTGLPAKIVYYCRKCEKLVKPKRVGKKFQFACTVCGADNVVFGSEQSICNYFKIPIEKTPDPAATNPLKN
jgi:hypothetical protein